MTEKTMLPTFGNYCFNCQNESRVPSRTCSYCGAMAVGRTPHYWEEPHKLRSRKYMIRQITGWFEMCARHRIEWPYVGEPGPDDDPSIKPTMGFHDCGDGSLELMGFDSYTQAQEEGTYYCSVETGWDVCMALQMDLMPESITHKLKGKYPL